MSSLFHSEFIKISTEKKLPIVPCELVIQLMVPNKKNNNKKSLIGIFSSSQLSLFFPRSSSVGVMGVVIIEQAENVRNQPSFHLSETGFFYAP